MSKTERNAEIVRRAAEMIKKRGLDGKLVMEPIPNAFKHRPTFFRRGDICFFSVFMWQLNELDDKEIDAALESRIETAIRYFGLSQ